MPYLSDIQHRRVLDASGDAVGTLKDLATASRDPLPAVEWAVLATSHGDRAVRWSDVAIEPAHVRLRRRLTSIGQERLPSDALHLGRDLLDKQVVDTESAATLRVNDLQLEEVVRELRLVGVEVGWRGLLRRIGLERPVGAFARLVRRPLRARIVPWSRIGLGSR